MDTASLLEGTRFEGSPVVKVSSTKRLGLDELLAEIDSAILSLPEKDYSKPARLPIDRVFTLKGVGTIVTGTLLSGKISQGAELVVYPRGLKARVRQIHMHNEKKGDVTAGNRVALNVAGVDKEEMRRGDVISEPGYVEPSVMFDVKLEVLEGVPPIKDWARVKLYIGSAEVLARTAILGKKEIGPGEVGYVQLRLEQRSVGKFGDRFVIRSYSPMRVLGGGVVLDSNPRKHKRSDELILNILEARNRGDASSVIGAHLNTGYFEIPVLRRSIDADEKGFTESVEAAAREGRAEILGDTVFDRQYLEGVRKRLSRALEDYHKQNPLQKGMSKEELRISAGMSPQTFDLLLLKSPGFEVLGDRVKLARMKLELNEQQVREREDIERLFRESGFSPPSKEEIASRYSNELFYSLVDSGTLVRLSQELVVHKDVLERGKSDIAAAVKKKGPLKLTEIKEILNTTRKYAVPVAEYLDRTGFTRRDGDLRTVA
jgi:selenocysteine-specific elongation factor